MVYPSDRTGMDQVTLSQRAAKVQQEFVREQTRHPVSDLALFLLVILLGLAIGMLIFWH